MAGLEALNSRANMLEALISRANMLHGEAVLAARRGDQDRLAEIRDELLEIGRQTDQIEAI